MLQNSLHIQPSPGGVGAFVDGIDLAQIDETQAAVLKTALGDHGVLFFRDQALSPDQHIAMAELFGGINVNRFFAHADGEPRIAEVRKEPDQKANIGSKNKVCSRGGRCVCLKHGGKVLCRVSGG